MAKIEKKNEYNKSFYNFRALASATAISEMAISVQIYNLLSNLPKNYQKKDYDEHEYDLTQKTFYYLTQKARKSQKGLRPAMRNVIKAHTDLTDHTGLFSGLPFIVRFFRYKYISAKSARSA